MLHLIAKGTMMQTDFQGTVTSFVVTDKGAEIDFGACGTDEVAHLVESFFLSSGFKLEKGDPTVGTYGSGSSAARILAGGFVKRKKYDVSIRPIDVSNVHASVASTMSGAGGGAIGVMKERKQRARFADELKAFLS
jgi:hypothetical protein